LTTDELVAGGKRLTRKVKRYEPRFLAVLGVTAYRAAFGRKDAGIGLQEISIGATRIWVLPNPSGLNAHYQLPALANEFRRLRRAL
jgi:TDG/mug DNA glycosylase family protein